MRLFHVEQAHSFFVGTFGNFLIDPVTLGKLRFFLSHITLLIFKERSPCTKGEF